MERVEKVFKGVFMAGGLLLLLSSASFGKDRDIPAEYKGMKNPVASSQEVFDAGKEIYKDKCQKCHGINGDGKGKSAKRMKPAPSDFTKKEEMGKATDGELFYITMEGSPDTEMNAYRKGKAKQGKELTDEEVWKTIHYIRQFAK